MSSLSCYACRLFFRFLIYLRCRSMRGKMRNEEAFSSGLGYGRWRIIKKCSARQYFGRVRDHAFQNGCGHLLQRVPDGDGRLHLEEQDTPGVKFFTLMIFFTMLFSGGVIPYYMLLKQLHLVNTIWVYVIPGLYSAWNIIIMRTFFSQISVSLEESAKLDGCNDFTTFIRIIMPLSKPVIAVISLFNAVGHWNDWFTGAFYVQKTNLRPVSTLLQEMLTRQDAIRAALMQNAGTTSYEILEKMQVTGNSLKMATIIVVVTPIICVSVCAEVFCRRRHDRIGQRIRRKRGCSPW